MTIALAALSMFVVVLLLVRRSVRNEISKVDRLRSAVDKAVQASVEIEKRIDRLDGKENKPS